VIRHFGFMTGLPCGRLLLGLTATPGRADGVGLARIFDKISFSYGMLEAIRDGWLCGLRGVRVRTGTNLDGVSSSDGEFSTRELSLAVNTPERNRLIVEEWLRTGETRKTIGFTVDIQHAKDLAEAFNDAGVKSEAVWGVDPERAEKLKAHKRGDFKVILNAGVLVEGYDDPEVQCVLLARPLRSALRYIQMVGRGTRLPKGIDNLLEAIARGLKLPKTDCLVMDFTDSSSRHSLVTLPSIFGLPPKLDMKGRPVAEIVQEFEEATAQRPETDFSELEDLSQIRSYIERIDLFEVKYAPEVEQNSKMQWHRTAEGDYVLNLPGRDKIALTKDLLGHWRIDGKVQGNEFESAEVELSAAFNTADTYLRYFGKNLMRLVRRESKSKMDKEPATSSQINAIKFNLRRLGRPIPDFTGVTKFEAAKVLNKLQAA
jgi:hypothetical protein